MSEKLPSSEALNLIEKLLTLDPARRISAKDALASDFFIKYDHNKAKEELAQVRIF